MACSKQFSITVGGAGLDWNDLVWVDNGSFTLNVATESHTATGDNFLLNVTATFPDGIAQASMQGTMVYAQAPAVNCNLHLSANTVVIIGGGALSALITITEDTGGGPVLVLLVSSWDPVADPEIDFPFTISGAAAIEVNIAANTSSDGVTPGTSEFDYDGLLTVIP